MDTEQMRTEAVGRDPGGTGPPEGAAERLGDPSSTRPRPLLFESLEARLAALDSLPRGFWLTGLTHSMGTLEARLAVLARWRGLLDRAIMPNQAKEETGADEPSPAGEAPAPVARVAAPWLGEGLAVKVARVFAELGLPGHCARNQGLGDAVLSSLMFHLDLVVDYVDRGASADTAVTMALDCFAADWSGRCQDVQALIDVFDDPGDLFKHCHWDRLRGLLREAGWQEVVRIRGLIERMPEVAEMIRELGRLREIEEGPPDPTTWQTRKVERAGRVPSVVTERVPELPGQTRAVTRSERIARMLPAESMMFVHPRLRLVWHARRAERALLTYEDDDWLTTVRAIDGSVTQPVVAPAPRRVLGPMLVCVDTSGSMRGGAETVAKAVVLEAARVAWRQRRGCTVFAFGGPDEVLELVLEMNEAGLARLTRFLARGFRGGTDICTPLERTLARLEQEGWREADLLLATDGEFGAPPDLAERILRARRHAGLRVQAVLIGDRETIGLHELSDHIHWVSDWRRFAASDARSGTGGSPVHSSRLTASYFPGALRTAENRKATVSGGDASRMVRAGGRADRNPPDRTRGGES